jgi:hypothetical protein
MYSPRRLRYSFDPVPVDGIYELTVNEPARYDDYPPPYKGGIIVNAETHLIKELTAEQVELLRLCKGVPRLIQAACDKLIPTIQTSPHPFPVGCKRKSKWWKQYGSVARETARANKIPGPPWERIAPIVTPNDPLVIEYQNYEPALRRYYETQEAYRARERYVKSVTKELTEIIENYLKRNS